MTRKRRRGIIEKRRRDRINHSLSELRRLVPSAFEKQGSAKLEKAEILQLTVDHLKMLHAKGQYHLSHSALDILLIIKFRPKKYLETNSEFLPNRFGCIGLRSAQIRHGLPQHWISRVYGGSGPLPGLGGRDGCPGSAPLAAHVSPAVLCRPT